MNITPPKLAAASALLAAGLLTMPIAGITWLYIVSL